MQQRQMADGQSATHAAYGRHHARAERLAQGLGWFSLGLGLTQFFAPRAVTRLLGMEGHEALMRMYGMREIANGAGLLSAQNKAPWLWGRVGGDALGLASLALGMGEDNRKRDNAILAAVMLGGVTALDFYCAQRLDTLKTLEEAPDYSSRSGFPRGAASVRGVASDEAKAMRPRFVDHPPQLGQRSREAVT